MGSKRRGKKRRSYDEAERIRNGIHRPRSSEMRSQDPYHNESTCCQSRDSNRSINLLSGKSIGKGVKVEEIPKPTISEKEILVKVHATVLDPIDFKFIDFISTRKPVSVSHGSTSSPASAGSKPGEWFLVVIKTRPLLPSGFPSTILIPKSTSNSEDNDPLKRKIAISVYSSAILSSQRSSYPSNL